jgi:hypothetical protein
MEREETPMAKSKPKHEVEKLEGNGEEFCDNEGCEARAWYRVPVSVNQAGDQTRCFCYACYCAYTIGVQHGATQPR